MPSSSVVRLWRPAGPLTSRPPWLVAGVLVALLLPLLGIVPARAAPAKPERVVVRLVPGQEASATKVAASTDGKVVREVTPGTVVVEVPAGKREGALRRLDADPRVDIARAPVRYRAVDGPSDPNDPAFQLCKTSPADGACQWGAHTVGGPRAWPINQGSPDVVVAVLDTGVDETHPDLLNKVIPGPNFSSSLSPTDLNGHGTHVAGTVAAVPDNGLGVTGIGWSTRVLAIKVLDDRGEAEDFQVAQGVRKAVEAGAEVINMSLAGPDSFVVRDAVQTAVRAGVLVVAAVGNQSFQGENLTTPLFPAAYGGVVGVAATGRDDRLAEFSFRGPWVDLAAPGVDIISTWSSANCGAITPPCNAVISGTSMASPHVAGAAALLIADNPGISAHELAFRLTRLAAPTPGGGFCPTMGRLDMPASLTGDGRGYWMVASDGGIFSFGAARLLGSMGGQPLNRPIVGLSAVPTGRGYWMVASDGGIFSFCDARFFGSTGGLRLNQPVVGMAASPSGNGYWLVASDGGIFRFGDARFFGSTGGLRLNRPIVGMAATTGGNGYWLVASDGGIFRFGDAPFLGSMGGQPLNRPIVGMAPTPTGNGYWMVASDGGIFSFGDARFHGSTGGAPLNQPIVGMVPTPSGNGYWLVASDGGVFSFGDARFLGSMGGTPLNRPILGAAF